MNASSHCLFSLKVSKILKPTYPFILHYCTNNSEKSSKILTIKIVGKGNQSPKKTKLALNTTNKVLFGPVQKKSPSSKTKDKKLTNKPLIIMHKKYSDLTFTKGNSEKIDSNNVIEDQNSENTEKENMSSRLLSSITSSNDHGSLLSSQSNTLTTELPLINMVKQDVLLNPKDNCIYNISIFKGGYKKLPSVSKILQETMPLERKLILKRWEQNMIQKLGEEGFKNYKQALFDQGKRFHSCIETKLRKKEIDEDQLVGIDQFWNSAKDILPNIEDVKMLESRVIHSYLQYQGLIDCVGFYKNVPVVIEFKTSIKPKLDVISTYDNPLQLAAYLGALNYDPAYINLPNINEALLVIAYDTGLPATVHLLSKEECQKYWSLWCQRLFKFQNMQTQNKEIK